MSRRPLRAGKKHPLAESSPARRELSRAAPCWRVVLAPWSADKCTLLLGYTGRQGASRPSRAPLPVLPASGSSARPAALQFHARVNSTIKCSSTSRRTLSGTSCGGVRSTGWPRLRTPRVRRRSRPRASSRRGSVTTSCTRMLRCRSSASGATWSTSSRSYAPRRSGSSRSAAATAARPCPCSALTPTRECTRPTSARLRSRSRATSRSGKASKTGSPRRPWARRTQPAAWRLARRLVTRVS